MARYLAVPAANCHVLPPDYPVELAVLSEPISIAFAAVARAGGLQGKNVAIIGPGPLGYLVALLAQLGGATRIFVLGLPRDAARLEFFRAHLRQPHLAQSREAMQSLLAEQTQGQGAEVVFEVSGAADGLDTALRLVAKLGTVVLLGIIAVSAQVDTNLAVRNQITIQGSPAAPGSLWRRMLAYLAGLPAEAQAQFSRVISQQLPLAQAEGAFARLAQGEGFKTVLRP